MLRLHVIKEERGQPEVVSCSQLGGEKSGKITNLWDDGGRCSMESRGMMWREPVEWRWQNLARRQALRQLDRPGRTPGNRGAELGGWSTV